MPFGENGVRYTYSCDSCDYEGDEVDRHHLAEEGRQVRCPECGRPHLTRKALWAPDDVATDTET